MSLGLQRTTYLRKTLTQRRRRWRTSPSRGGGGGGGSDSSLQFLGSINGLDSTQCCWNASCPCWVPLLLPREVWGPELRNHQHRLKCTPKVEGMWKVYKYFRRTRTSWYVLVSCFEQPFKCKSAVTDPPFRNDTIVVGFADTGRSPTKTLRRQCCWNQISQLPPSSFIRPSKCSCLQQHRGWRSMVMVVQWRRNDLIYM